jgi:hypothetical protein
MRKVKKRKQEDVNQFGEKPGTDTTNSANTAIRSRLSDLQSQISGKDRAFRMRKKGSYKYSIPEASCCFLGLHVTNENVVGDLKMFLSEKRSYIF